MSEEIENLKTVETTEEQQVRFFSAERKSITGNIYVLALSVC